MNNAFKNDKYWILAGLTLIVLIFVFYSSSPFKSFPMNISRGEAISIAEEYLNKENIDVSGMYKEGIVDENTVVNKYLLKKLGSEGLEKFSKKEKLGNYGWVVIFHENKASNEPHITYTLGLSNNGNIISYERSIPDTSVIPSVTLDEAKKIITKVIQSRLNIELNDFVLVKSEQNNLNQRTDYFFRWEKDVEGVEGKILVEAQVQGNQAAMYKVGFHVPDKYRNVINTQEALFGTASVIFVAFLMVFALFFFLKKYHQGEIWINAGKFFFLIYFIIALFLIANNWPNVGLNVTMGTLSFISVKVIVLLINGLVIQFLLALLVFAAWSVGESYGREFWPEKLKGIDSLVKGHFFTISSGYSALRGLVLGTGLAFIYLVMSILLDGHDSSFFISPISNFEVFYGYVPVLDTIGKSFLAASLTGITTTFFVVNFVYSKKPNKLISILAAGVVSMLANVIVATPPSVNELGANIVIYFIFGTALAYIYFKFDFLTLLIMLFYSTVIYDVFTIYPSSGYFSINFWIITIALFAAPLIYLISRIKKQEFILKDYGLPSHVEKISERERLKKELEIAAKVQLSLLPKEQPKLEEYDIAGLSIPAKEAGGDYYDFVKLSDNKIGIAVGDVSGKGVGAAIYMTLTKGILQAHAEENVSPRVVLGKVNRLLYKTIEKNSFVSMFYAVLDPVKHTLLYARAGHNPGIFCSFKETNSKLLVSRGMALGLEEGKIFNETLHEDTIELKNGDVVVLYTDGFTEAMNASLEQFGEKKLIEIVEKNRYKSSNDLLNLILKDVRKFTKEHPQHDDMTIVVLKRK